MNDEISYNKKENKVPVVRGILLYSSKFCAVVSNKVVVHFTTFIKKIPAQCAGGSFDPKSLKEPEVMDIRLHMATK